MRKFSGVGNMKLSDFNELRDVVVVHASVIRRLKWLK